MNRLERIAKSNELAGVRIIVTGCGYKPVQNVFHDIVTKEPSHDSIIVDGTEMKLNIGSATAGVLALSGAIVHIVSTSRDKLKNIKNSLDAIVGNGNQLEFSAVNLLNESEIKDFVNRINMDKPIYWVQALGLSGGTYKVKDDNPYLTIEDIDPKLMEAELSVLVSTHNLMRALLPRFKQQRETRVAIITSMS